MILLFVFGTRPEAIKLAPIILKAKEDKSIKVKICVTGQHKEMLYQVLNFFKIKPDIDLEIMKHNQSLADVTAEAILKLDNVVKKYSPDVVIVQGDTTSAMTGALVAFYNKIKVAHVEAGLRTYDKYSPFPEEVNRKIISGFADFHFVPTSVGKDNLFKENIRKNVFNVGNSVIDALLLGLKIVNKKSKASKQKFSYVDSRKKIILVTCHRRESFGKAFVNICEALIEISKKNPGVQILYPVHPNPNIRENAFKLLSGYKNIVLTEPFDYPSLIWLMSKSYLIITDSGGIQEEAPSLNVPVLVIRNHTERPEGIKAGTSILVGTGKKNIVSKVNTLLHDKKVYNKMAKAKTPYGDGTTSQKILKILKERKDKKNV